MSNTLIWTPGMPLTSMGVGTVAMQTGYSLSMQLITDVMQTQAPAQLTALQALTTSTEPQVLVVDGDYDQMHHLLEAARITHARIPNSSFLKAALKELPGIRAILANCGKGFDAGAAHRAAGFVKEGGLLVTSDWSLANVVEVAFPGTIRHNGRKTTNDFAHLDHLRDMDPVIEKLFSAAPGEKPIWWLESSSYPIERLAQGVKVLLYSKEMHEKYGNGSIMVAFQHGAGLVFHMVSHAFLQQRGPRTAQIEKGTSVTYTTSLGASPKTSVAYARAESEVADFDGTAAAGSATSMGIFLRTLISIGEKKKETTDGSTGQE